MSALFGSDGLVWKIAHAGTVFTWWLTVGVCLVTIIATVVVGNYLYAALTALGLFIGWCLMRGVPGRGR